jgi:hypothetical protein
VISPWFWFVVQDGISCGRFSLCCHCGVFSDVLVSMLVID